MSCRTETKHIFDKKNKQIRVIINLFFRICSCLVSAKWGTRKFC